MMNSKRTLLSAFLFVLAAGWNLGGLKAEGMCFFDKISVGADFLYWQPCAADTDYAIKAKHDDLDTAKHFHTKYIHPRWDSGVRAWAKADNIFCGFGGAAVYTYFDTEKKSTARSRIEDSLELSTSLPFDADTPVGHFASGKWDLQYQTLDLVLNYPLQISCDKNFAVSAFSGVSLLIYSQKRHDHLRGVDDTSTTRFTIHRDLNFWGAGPTFGVNTHYDFCGCLKVFGIMSTSLIVGENDAKDHFKFKDNGNTGANFNVRYRNNDECFCFPGFHFASGIAYEMCLCEMDVAFHAGWEYLHWINAPSFTYYEQGERGVRSANSSKSFTLQGIFVGANLSF